MCAEINITDKDIVFAESILLEEGKRFDEERIQFFKNLDTIDLQAVPGSGKTTALMAKLLILEQYLPFEDGSGILVISHTNAAVDEIKEKLERYCPKLFSPPNFVGTIQKFTDEFLAIPYYVNKYKKKITHIDDDVYNIYAQKYFHTRIDESYSQRQKNARHFLKGNRDLCHSYRCSYIEGKIVLTNEYLGKALEIKKPKGNTRIENYTDWTDKEKQEVEEWLIKFKQRLMKDGVLCFDDAYFLASLYLVKFPRIRGILQKRFQFVFVDEVQDMEKHQHDLLENVFFDNGKSSSIYQRIGDKNQAIYGRNLEFDENWVPRSKVLPINGSHRLSPPVAELVNCFALHRTTGFQVNGLRDGDIPPHLIVYDDSTITNVLEKYSELIKGLIDKEKIGVEDSKFKAIGWRKEGKLGVTHYFPSFDDNKHKVKIQHSSLQHYLDSTGQSEASLAPIQTNILNALLQVLRIEGVQTDEDRFFTRSSLLSYLRLNHEAEYDCLKLKLYQWSMKVVKEENVLDEIRTYIPTLLKVFSSAIKESKKFIDEVSPKEDSETPLIEEPMKSNSVNYHGFDIEVTTIHSEKGKTHNGTLYLETFHGRGKGNYESQRLAEQFLFIPFDSQKEKIKVVKQSTKMMYVGISRPTHLLCVAVHKDRYDECLSKIDKSKWNVIFLEPNKNEEQPH